jgi:hypothetical protein
MRKTLRCVMHPGSDTRKRYASPAGRILHIAGTLDEASTKNVTLTGGALAKNVFWQTAKAPSPLEQPRTSRERSCLRR